MWLVYLCTLSISLALKTSPASPHMSSHTWPVTGQPKALVFVSHGYGEHLQPYYDGIGEACGAAGLLCWGHDHLGFGNSGGARTMVDSMQNYTAPLLAACRRMQGQHPRLPLFLLGHSMGGLIALTADLESPDLFDGLVLTAPLIQASQDNPLNRLVTKVISSLCHSCSLPFLRLNITQTTKSKVWQDYIRSDPLSYHGGYKFGPTQVGFEAVDALKERMERITTPLLVLHGEEDELCLLSGSQELVARARSRDKELVVVPGAGHHLLLERLDVVKDKMLNWILDRSQ